MSLIDKLVEWSLKKEAQMLGTEPRRMTHTELGRLFDAGIQKPPTSTTIEELRKNIRLRNPVRWKRLQKELRWVEKQMKKMGHNPEDARWIL